MLPRFCASFPPLSSEYMCSANCICFRLLRQEMPSAFALALLKAGSSSAARIAMIAITTSSSMRVNAGLRSPRGGSESTDHADLTSGSLGYGETYLYLAHRSRQGNHMFMWLDRVPASPILDHDDPKGLRKNNYLPAGGKQTLQGAGHRRAFWHCLRTARPSRLAARRNAWARRN